MAQRTELAGIGLFNPATFAGAVVVTVVSGLIVTWVWDEIRGGGKKRR